MYKSQSGQVNSHYDSLYKTEYTNQSQENSTNQNLVIGSNY